MKPLLPVLILIFLYNFTYTCFAQSVSARIITPLSSDLNEISGWIQVNNTFIGLNDSGSEPELLEFDTLSGNVLRVVHVANANNTDWEDLAADNSHIYIGDFGNNNGSRTDLKIYKISISNFLNTFNDTVIADSITFNYTDQTDFTPTNLTTNFDCEALAIQNDSLILFSKNWSNNKSRIYKLPTTPGNYAISPRATINTNGLVTGAHFSLTTQTHWLCGYQFTGGTDQFLIKMDTNFNFQRYSISNLIGSFQVESISNITNQTAGVATESFGSYGAVFYEITEEALKIDEYSSDLRHQIINGILSFDGKLNQIEIFDSYGRFISTSNDSNVNIKGLASGMYHIRYQTQPNDYYHRISIFINKP